MLLMILRVKGASHRDVNTCHDWCYLSLVDLRLTRGDNGRYIGGKYQMRTYVISSRLYVILLLICLCVLVSCGQSTSTNNAKPAPAVLDAYGTPITFPHNAPQRIVSLVPSTSEILGALHLQSKVVGVDNYTDYPADIAKLPKVSDATGKVNVEQVLHLKPDLVLSDGGLTKPYDGQLANLGLHVVDLPSADFEQSLQQIALVG